MGISGYLRIEVLKQIYNTREGVKNPLLCINPLSNVVSIFDYHRIQCLLSSLIHLSKVVSIYGKDRQIVCPRKSKPVTGPRDIMKYYLPKIVIQTARAKLS